MFMFLSVIEWC